MVVDSANNIIVADTFNNRIQVFGLGNTGTGTAVVVPITDATTGETLTITFDEVTQGGETTVSSSSSGVPPPSGFELITDPPTYYEINTTAIFQGTATVCINYPGSLSIAVERGLKLFHYEDTDGDGIPDTWVDVTKSKDMVNNIICGEVTSFSPFAIFVENNVPEPTPTPEASPTPQVSPSPTPTPTPTEPPTAITLLYFKARAVADGSVILTWKTATEVDNAGFNIYRARSEGGLYTKINNTLIPARGNATSGAWYKFTDTPGEGKSYYKLEDVDYNGVSTMHGPVSSKKLKRSKR